MKLYKLAAKSDFSGSTKPLLMWNTETGSGNWKLHTVSSSDWDLTTVVGQNKTLEWIGMRRKVNLNYTFAMSLDFQFKVIHIQHTVFSQFDWGLTFLREIYFTFSAKVLKPLLVSLVSPSSPLNDPCSMASWWLVLILAMSQTVSKSPKIVNSYSLHENVVRRLSERDEKLSQEFQTRCQVKGYTVSRSISWFRTWSILQPLERVGWIFPRKRLKTSNFCCS